MEKRNEKGEERKGKRGNGSEGEIEELKWRREKNGSIEEEGNGEGKNEKGWVKERAPCVWK